MGRHGIEAQDIVNWEAYKKQRGKQPLALLPKGFEVFYNSAVKLHLSSNFWVWKPLEEQQGIFVGNGFPSDIDPNLLPNNIRQELIEKVQLDNNGKFTFLPGQLVLGQTEEEIEIPATQSWRMGDYFVQEQTRKILPLTTHQTAPLLHPFSRGQQTYEIVNVSKEPLVVTPKDLICITFIAEYNGSASEPKGKFNTRKKGEMRSPSPLSEEEKQLLRSHMEGGNSA